MAQARTVQRTTPAKKPAEIPRAWSHGAFYWNELLTRDVERDKRFYREAIGWTFEPMPMTEGWADGTYWVASVEGRPVGGLFPLASPKFDGVPEGWMSYLAVDDVDKRVAKAVKLGAKLMRPIWDIPHVGRIAMLTEPGGAGIGWMRPPQSPAA